MAKKRSRRSTKTTATKPAILGTWKITEMEQWDEDYIDLDGPGLIKFARGHHGDLKFGAMQSGLDWRLDEPSGAVEFTFHGFDEGDEVSGRGKARLDPDGSLRGRLWFHLGEESHFVAERSSRTTGGRCSLR